MIVKKLVRWRFRNMFSILSIFYDFLAMKFFKIPISLSKLQLKFHNDARFARIDEK